MKMLEYTCRSCKDRLLTKGPSRSQFIISEDFTVESLRSAFRLDVEPDKYREGENDLVLRMSMWKNSDQSNTGDKALELMAHRLTTITKEQLIHAFCEHDWMLTKGDEKDAI